VCEERETINKKGRSSDEREGNHERDRNIKGCVGEKSVVDDPFPKFYRLCFFF